MYLDPCPPWQEREAHYQARYLGYYDRDMATSTLQRAAVAFGLRKRWRVFAPFVSGGRLLDVGCGSGDFLRWMQTRPGWQAFGVERNPGISSVSVHHGTKITLGDANTLPFPDKSFEVVMLWTVLEHVEDPLSGLRECVRVLRRGGMLVVRTVTTDSWGAKWFGPYWVGFDAPRVMTVFSKSTLRQILEQTGVNVLSLGAYFYDFHPFLWSFRNFCHARLPGRWGRFFGHLPHSWVLQALTLPYFALQTALEGNSFVTALARKP